MIAGAIQLVFMYCGPRGSPAPHSSSPMTICSHAEALRPPNSGGQCGIHAPTAASRWHTCLEISTSSGMKTSRLRDVQPAGTVSSTTWRTTARNCCSSADQSNSTHAPSAGVTVSVNRG